MVTPDIIRTFIDNAIASEARVKRFSSFQEAIDFVSLFLKREKIQNIAVAPDALCFIKATNEISILEPRCAEDYLRAEAGLVLAHYGVAETGTLVHLDCKDEEKIAWTLPPLCLCLLEKSRIVADLESLSSILSEHLSLTTIPSPQVSLVTGPSRTADIECQLSIGVHGPSSLLILLVDGNPE